MYVYNSKVRAVISAARNQLWARLGLERPLCNSLCLGKLFSIINFVASAVYHQKQCLRGSFVSFNPLSTQYGRN